MGGYVQRYRDWPGQKERQSPPTSWLAATCGVPQSKDRTYEGQNEEDEGDASTGSR